MGFVAVLGPCIRCKRPFVYSPTRVPSIRVDGVREPVCQTCLDAVNPLRVRGGFPPLVALPGAYEADDEAALILSDAWDPGPDDDEEDR